MSVDAITNAPPAADASRAAPRGPGRAALRLAAAGVGLISAAFAVTAAIVFGVPEGNDYALAARIKHDRLVSPAPRKIVLIGGSNLTFGVDSAAVEAATGCQVANMGINGYLGVRFMLNQAEPNLRPGDIAVIALEYDSFFKSVNGTPQDQLIVVKSSPVTFRYFTWRQRLGMLKAIPFVAQQKVLRLMRETYDHVSGDQDDEARELAEDIETVEAITPQGDLTSHLGVTWPYDREDGLDASGLPVDPEIIGLLQGFAARSEARGVHVVMSYTSVIRDYYERHAASLERLHERIVQAPPLDPPSTPRDYMYDEDKFFDTVYHLNAEGRAIRTARLVDDLRRQLDGEAECSPGSAPTNGGVADD